MVLSLYFLQYIMQIVFLKKNLKLLDTEQYNEYWQTRKRKTVCEGKT